MVQFCACHCWSTVYFATLILSLRKDVGDELERLYTLQQKKIQQNKKPKWLLARRNEVYKNKVSQTVQFCACHCWSTVYFATLILSLRKDELERLYTLQQKKDTTKQKTEYLILNCTRPLTQKTQITKCNLAASSKVDNPKGNMCLLVWFNILSQVLEVDTHRFKKA